MVARAPSRRIRSTAHRRAVVRSHATGLSGMPSRGHVSQRAQAGVLHGVLGEGEVAGPAGERGEDVAAGIPHEVGEDAVGVLGGGGRHPRGGAAHIPKSMTGRTSTAPFQAPGMVAATAIASSRSAHSRR